MLDALAARSLSPALPEPHAEMRACVIVPARNEEGCVRQLLAALTAQRDTRGQLLDPHTYEVLLLLNNCTDRTAEVARAFGREFPRLALRIAEAQLPAAQAHAGRARQALFDMAFERFQSLDRPDGLILSTDADSRPAPDWIAQTEAEIAAGADGVGGRVILDPEERAALPSAVNRMFLLDIGYRRALEELHSLYAPDRHDPFPRHHQHFGASLAVTAAAYGRAGGMPSRRSSEDVALYRAIIKSGGKFRHSPRVKVTTSARIVGRATGGLADAIHWWSDQARDVAPVLVESATAANARLARLGRWRLEHPFASTPDELTAVPEPPPAGDSAEIHAVLRELRVIIAKLRPLSLAARLRETERPFNREAASLAEMAA
jgi:hypothetical protein